MGVDIARQGSDQTVIRFRQGLDARSIPAVKFRIPDLMQVASRVLEQVELHKPAAVFVDATGIGWGVFDRLGQLGCEGLVAVDFGGKADRTDGGAVGDAKALYANKRSEMWGFLKDWCKLGCLPDDRDLAADLTGVVAVLDAGEVGDAIEVRLSGVRDDLTLLSIGEIADASARPVVLADHQVRLAPLFARQRECPGRIVLLHRPALRVHLHQALDEHVAPARPWLRA